MNTLNIANLKIYPHHMCFRKFNLAPVAWKCSGNRSYARKIKLAEFGIKKFGFKSYMENLKGKPKT